MTPCQVPFFHNVRRFVYPILSNDRVGGAVDLSRSNPIDMTLSSFIIVTNGNGLHLIDARFSPPRCQKEGRVIESTEMTLGLNAMVFRCYEIRRLVLDRRE